MKALKFNAWIILSLFILIMVSCGGGGSGGSSGGGGTGTLSVGLTDSSTSKYLAIYVTIDEVQVNKKKSSTGNYGWRTVATPMKTYNLLKLVNGITEILSEDELEAGTYQQIRLIIGKTAESENNINGEPHPDANYVVLKDGSYGHLKIPSGYQTGVILVHNFVVEDGSFVDLVLDFEACKSVVETGSGKYILNPTIKVIETANKYFVYGRVTEYGTDPAIPITGALVSAQISDGFSTTVVRSTLTSDDEGEEGQYSLLLSPGQTYNMVVYSDKKVDGQLYSPACAEIVPLNDDIQQDFTMEKSEFGTISGEVPFIGDIDENDPPIINLSFYTTLECGDNDYIEVTSLLVSPDQGSQIYEYSSVSPDSVSYIYKYSVDLPLGEYDVVASSIGFSPVTETVDLCNYTISPPSRSFTSSGGAGSISVTSPSACTWNALESVDWINITSGSSGSGNGTVTYEVSDNTTESPRIAVITVAGQSHTVIQEPPVPPDCNTSSISPPSRSFTSSGGAGSISVTSSSACTWNATESVDWIDITSGSSGSGNGTVTYEVSDNTTESPRIAVITVAGQSHTVIQEPPVPPDCNTSSISPPSRSFTSSGGAGSISVTSSSACTWNALEGVDWIDITSGSSGSGNGTVTYEVSDNTTGSSRTAIITVAGQTHTVTQAPCTYSISPPSQSFTSSEGTGSISVTSSETTCTWNATESVDWIDITSGSSGSGNGTVTYEVSDNTTGSPRTAVITVAGQTHTVTQAPCTYSISPPSQSFTSSEGTGSISVTSSETTCTWNATESVDWIYITSGSSGSGNGTATYEVSDNTTESPRIAVITVAGQSHTVIQEPPVPPDCNTSSISPPSRSFTSSGGAGSISVTSSSACTWNALEGVDWIDITSGSSGSGNGTVTYEVSDNTTGSSRTAIITVAGQTHTVTQAPCTYSISPPSQSFTSSEGTGSISVTSSETTCTWNATESVDWINITSGSSGSGNGTVTYEVSANTTESPRIAVITVAGQSHTVIQEPPVPPDCNTSSISPPSRSFTSSGGAGSISVTSSSACTWNALEGVDWIDITSGSSGSGNGTVTYEVSDNTTGSSRTAIITVAGQTHTVTQAPCTYSISPPSQSFTSSEGTGSISVTSSETTCTWNATESVDWIDITSGSSGSGNGTVTYEVSDNTTESPRTAVITVAGQSHTVTQQPEPIISGYALTASGGPLSRVTLTFSNNGGTATTNPSGFYSQAVPYGWSGTVTPSMSGYTFNPLSRSYSNVTSNQSNQNYTVTQAP